MVNTVDRDLHSKHESMADAAIRGRLATGAGPKRWRTGTKYPGISRLGTCTGQQTCYGWRGDSNRMARETSVFAN